MTYLSSTHSLLCSAGHCICYALPFWDQAGKNVHFTSCRIFSLGDGGERTLVAMGVHTKKVVAGLRMVPPNAKL